MFRTFLSLVALSTFIIAQPHVAAAAQAPSASRSSAKVALTGTININTAAAKDFEALPGIGSKTAALIVEYRQKNGPFKKIEELMNVSGVGEKSFLKLKPRLAVTAAKAADGQPEQR